MRTTIWDVARAAGVTDATVSNVLNGKGRTSETTRQRVLEAAANLGYRRDEVARAMVVGHNRVIGLLTYNGTPENIANIIGGALDEAATDGYATKILHLPFHGKREDTLEMLQRCRSWRLAGLVAINLKPECLALLHEEMEKSPCPIAHVECAPEGKDAICVYSDDEGAIREALEYVVALGHRQIAYLSGVEGNKIAIKRIEIFRRLAGEMGLPIAAQSTHFSDWGNSEIISQAVLNLLHVPQRPTALLCAGDALAMVALRVARQQGLVVPDDLSVIGFGNFDLVKFSDPALTTISQPFNKMGSVAVKRILSLLSEKSTLPETNNSSCDILSTRLIIRESTGPAPAKYSVTSNRQVADLTTATI